ncbi:MAG: hypothetical protein U0133_06310 [Gemmatimonadales bacterium]
MRRCSWRGLRRDRGTGEVDKPSGAGFTVADYVEPWASAFPASVGASLSLFAFLAAVYLTCEAKDQDLGGLRRRALGRRRGVRHRLRHPAARTERSPPLVWHG